MTSCAAIGCHADAVTVIVIADDQKPFCAEHAVAAPAANYSLEAFES
jgi:hypothetical protein